MQHSSHRSRGTAIYGEGQINGFKAVADLANARNGILVGKQIEIVPMDIKVGAKDILPSIRRAMERPPM